MHLSTQNDVRSPPRSGDQINAGRPPAGGLRPQPLTSGYGVLLEKEERLLATNRDYIGDVYGAHSGALWRILREHQLLLESNLALLKHRCESLPHGERFVPLYAEHIDSAPHDDASAPPREMSGLADLIARHASLIGDVDALIARARHGERDEPDLTEIERNHEGMAWMLQALQKEDDALSPPAPWEPSSA